MRVDRFRGRGQGTALLLAALFLLAAPPTVSPAEPPTDPGDESFIRAVESAPPDAPLDRKRLAKLFYGLGATLDGGKTSVALLRSRVRVPEGSGKAVRSTVNSSYQRYAAAVERFKGSVSGLLDRPDSTPRLYLALSDGTEACWLLTEFTGLVETFGVRNPDLLSVLSSTEACARFRRVAFQPSVANTIVRELDQSQAQRDELRELQIEFDELDRLLQDLRSIEAGE